MKEPMLTNSTLAVILGVKDKQLNRLRRKGILPQPDEMAGRRQQYRVSTIREYLEKRSVDERGRTAIPAQAQLFRLNLLYPKGEK